MKRNAMVLLTLGSTLFVLWGCTQKAAMQMAMAVAPQEQKLMWQGDFAQAAVMIEQRMTEAEQRHGIDSRQVMTLLQQLPGAYIQIGDYPNVTNAARRQLAHIEKFPALYRHSRETMEISALMLLGQGYRMMGDDEHAEATYNQLLDKLKRQAANPAQDLMLVTAYYSLAWLQAERGHQEQADRFADEGRNRLEKAFAQGNAQYVVGLMSMAIQYYAFADQADRGVNLARKALASVSQGRLPAKSAGMANIMLDQGELLRLQALDGLAEALLYSHDYHGARRVLAEAESLFEAIGFMKSSLGYHRAQIAVKRAQIESVEGNFVEADRLMQIAMQEWEGMAGPGNMLSSHMLQMHAFSLGCQGNVARALKYLKEVTGRENEILLNASAFTSERQKLALAWKHRPTLEATLSLVHRQAPRDPSALRQTLDLLLVRKGIVFDLLARQNVASAQSSAPETRALLENLSQYRGALAKLLMETPTGSGTKTAGNQRPEASREAKSRYLISKIEGLEKEIAARNRSLFERIAHTPGHRPGRGRTPCGGQCPGGVRQNPGL
jgi:tetratricopeptide (TPR) repeat protein